MAIGLAFLKGLKRSRVSQAFQDFCQKLVGSGGLPGMAPVEDPPGS